MFYKENSKTSIKGIFPRKTLAEYGVTQTKKPVFGLKSFETRSMAP